MVLSFFAGGHVETQYYLKKNNDFIILGGLLHQENIRLILKMYGSCEYLGAQAHILSFWQATSNCIEDFSNAKLFYLEYITYELRFLCKFVHVILITFCAS